jgi:hypothetical protein
MSWKDIVKESRFEKLKSVMMKYYGDENFDWLDGLEEQDIDGFIKYEIEELKANLETVPKDGKFSDGEDASEYIESANSLIRELEKI